MSREMAVSLQDETHARLRMLAKRIGRTEASIICEAIEEHLDELEDIYLSEKTLERIGRGQVRTHTLDEVERELGLDDPRRGR